MNGSYTVWTRNAYTGERKCHTLNYPMNKLQAVAMARRDALYNKKGRHAEVDDPSGNTILSVPPSKNRPHMVLFNPSTMTRKKRI